MRGYVSEHFAWLVVKPFYHPLHLPISDVNQFRALGEVLPE